MKQQSTEQLMLNRKINELLAERVDLVERLVSDVENEKNIRNRVNNIDYCVEVLREVQR